MTDLEPTGEPSAAILSLDAEAIAKVIDRWYGGAATARQMSAIIAGRMLEDRTGGT